MYLTQTQTQTQTYYMAPNFSWSLMGFDRASRILVIRSSLRAR